jgi:hypothetical protein
LYTAPATVEDAPLCPLEGAVPGALEEGAPRCSFEPAARLGVAGADALRREAATAPATPPPTAPAISASTNAADPPRWRRRDIVPVGWGAGGGVAGVAGGGVTGAAGDGWSFCSGV